MAEDLLSMSDSERLRFLLAQKRGRLKLLFKFEKDRGIHPRVLLTFIRAFREAGMQMPAYRGVEDTEHKELYDYMAFTDPTREPKEHAEQLLWAPATEATPLCDRLPRRSHWWDSVAWRSRMVR